MIDLKELNDWISDGEGKAWLEGQKKPLIDKRDELLTELQKANGKGAQALQRSADAERILEEERASVFSLVVDRELDRLLQNERMSDVLRPGVIASIKNSNGITVKADGQNREALVTVKDADGKEKQLPLAAYFKDVWSKTEAAKQVLPFNGGSGSGAQGGAGGSGGQYTREKIAAMSPTEVAKVYDTPEFQDALKKL